MEDYFVMILKLLNVIHWENKIILQYLLGKEKADSVCKAIEKAFDESMA